MSGVPSLKIVTVPETWTDKDVVFLGGMSNKLYTGELVKVRHGLADLRLLSVH